MLASIADKHNYLMKITLAVFLFLLCSNLQAQDLKNTDWVQVKLERKDGSKILYHQQSEEPIIQYYFKEHSVLVFINNLFARELNYSVNQHILSLGEFAKFKIDTLDREILVLNQIPEIELPDDKINRTIFINRLSIFEYLKENKQLNIIGDSLIEFNNQLFPTYYGDIDKLFTTELKSQTDNKTLSGSLTINPGGNIKNIQLEPTNKFSKKEIDKILQIINSTSGKWMMPSTPHPFQYKSHFVLEFLFYNPLSSSSFSWGTIGLKQDKQKSLTRKEIADAENYYNKGVEFIQRENFEKASKQFVKCIEIDSIYIDAYYNLAFCYQKLGNKNMACETWSKLKEMGQKQGEYLHDENCK